SDAFFFSSRRRHTRFSRDWSSDVCSSDLYADCHLPETAKRKQGNFDWRQAIGWLTESAARQGYETLVVTDTKTDIDAWLRVGDRSEERRVGKEWRTRWSTYDQKMYVA